MSLSSADLLLTGRYLLTMDAEQTLIEQGGVAIAGDTIVAVGPAAELRARIEEENAKKWSAVTPVGPS